MDSWDKIENDNLLKSSCVYKRHNYVFDLNSFTKYALYFFLALFQDFDDDEDDEAEESFNKSNSSGMCFYRHICSSDGTQSTPVSPWKSKPSIGKLNKSKAKW